MRKIPHRSQPRNPETPHCVVATRTADTGSLSADVNLPRSLRLWHQRAGADTPFQVSLVTKARNTWTLSRSKASEQYVEGMQKTERGLSLERV